MQHSVHIAVLITSHNRREKTLTCLASLLGQSLPGDVSIRVFLVDDGSTDGTSEAVEARFPEVVLIRASGTAYWNGGMRLAFAEAVKSPYDFLLWLNDDTVLNEGAVETLLGEYDAVSNGGALTSMIAGATVDRKTGVVLSGGYRLKPPEFLCRFALQPPAGSPQLCHALSGNCLLIPARVAGELGNLSSDYTHFLGDFDYALRARKAGFGVWLASRPVGHGTSDAVDANEVLNAEHMGDVFNRLHSPKGLSVGVGEHHRTMPPREWRFFLEAHAGMLWPIPWLITYSKLALPLAKRAIAGSIRKRHGDQA
jgi:glycosyltransferase involved in cell wall biosynthesis